MLTAATHTLIYDGFQHGDVSGVPAFCQQAQSRRAKEIGEHLANFAKLKSLYDRTPDGETDAVCEEMEAEEDWLARQLGF
jgi:hypothetical protein